MKQKIDGDLGQLAMRLGELQREFEGRLHVTSPEQITELIGYAVEQYAQNRAINSSDLGMLRNEAAMIACKSIEGMQKKYDFQNPFTVNYVNGKTDYARTR